MAEAITIPSPSVFLRASPDPPSAPAPQPSASKNVRRPAGAETKKKAPRKQGAAVSGTDGGVAKPKQSKSRNGIYLPSASLIMKPDEHTDGV